MGGRTVSDPGAPTPASPWPETPWSTVRRARDGEAFDRRAALDRLTHVYYVPVGRFFARALRIAQDEAEDVTQAFFARLLERDFLEGITHETSFRGFLKLACRRHCASWRAAASASRRRLQGLALELTAAEEPDVDPLDEELRRHYVEEARRRLEAELRRRGKDGLLAVFEARTRFDGSRPEEHAAIAARLGLRVHDVQNRIAHARKIFRKELLRIAGERSEDPRGELRELGLLRFIET